MPGWSDCGVNVCMCESVCGYGRTCIHPVKVRWVNVCGSEGWPGQCPHMIILLNSHSFQLCGTNILTPTVRLWGVYSISEQVFFLPCVRLGSAQDGFAVPKQDLRKPQALLERIHPTPPKNREANTEPSDDEWAGQQIPWVLKLWPRGKKINIFLFQWELFKQIYCLSPFQFRLEKKSVLLSLVSARLFWFPKIFSEA